MYNNITHNLYIINATSYLYNQDHPVLITTLELVEATVQAKLAAFESLVLNPNLEGEGKDDEYLDNKL